MSDSLLTLVHLRFCCVKAEISDIQCGRVGEQATLGFPVNLHVNPRYARFKKSRYL